MPPARAVSPRAALRSVETRDLPPLKLVTCHLGHDTTLAVHGRFQLVDEQRWFGRMLEDVGVDEMFERRPAAANKRRVVDRVGIVLVGS